MTLNEAKTRFLEDIKRRSPNTIRAYDLAIRQLTSFIGDPDFQAEALTTELALAAIRRVHVRSVSRNTLATYITGVKAFLKWLILEDLVAFDLIALERLGERMKAFLGPSPNRLPHVPTDDAIDAVIEAARAVVPTTPRLRVLAARNVALLETLKSTGARVSEIVHMMCGDLNHQDRSALVRGKGDKERLVFFDTASWAALLAYLDLRDDDHSNGQPLFIRFDRSATGKNLPMSPTAVRNVVSEFTVEAGVDERLHPHAFRHRVGTKMLTATGDLAATQDVLGHSSPNTTRIYARLAGPRLRAAFDRTEL